MTRRVIEAKTEEVELERINENLKRVRACQRERRVAELRRAAGNLPDDLQRVREEIQRLMDEEE